MEITLPSMTIFLLLIGFLNRLVDTSLHAINTEELCVYSSHRLVFKIGGGGRGWDSFPFITSDILMRMAIKAVIFDLGGVLLRTDDFTPREQLAKRLNMDRHELEEFIFGGDSGDKAQRGEIRIEQHFANLCYQIGYTPLQFQQLVGEFFSRDRLDEELVDYVRRLHKQYKTALLSNAWDDLRKRIAEMWHFEDAFDLLVISAEVGVAKPDPKIFRLALDQLGVQASESIFVDDFQRNVDAARGVGMNAIRFENPRQVREELGRMLNGR
jgi:epoxide hydrolase-like predicted phosphatase